MQTSNEDLKAENAVHTNNTNSRISDLLVASRKINRPKGKYHICIYIYEKKNL